MNNNYLGLDSMTFTGINLKRLMKYGFVMHKSIRNCIIIPNGWKCIKNIDKTELYNKNNKLVFSYHSGCSIKWY